jgi:hypothetical protein
MNTAKIYCPEENAHEPIGVRLPIESLGGDVYRCKCGCRFRMIDSEHWETLESSPAMVARVKQSRRRHPYQRGE